MNKHAPPIAIWACLTVFLLAWLAVFAPGHKVELMVYKITLVAISSFVGLMIDYVMFPGSRPKDLVGGNRSFAESRRATIVAGAMICIGVGL